MVDKLLRVPKEQALSSVAARVPRWVHPITITLIALGFGLAAALAAWQQAYSLALALWLLNRALDGLDGTVARLSRRQSDLGAYVDILADTLMYAAIPAAVALSVGTPAAYLSLLALLAAFYVNGASWMYLSAILEKRRHGAAARREMTSVTMPSGLLEGAETILFFSLFLLFPGALVPLFLLMAVLTVVTVVHRLLWAVAELRRS